MHVLVIVIGVLLALFGGTCVILLTSLGAGNEAGMGILGVFVGLGLIWIGVVMGRDKRKAKAEAEDQPE